MNQHFTGFNRSVASLYGQRESLSAVVPILSNHSAIYMQTLDGPAFQLGDTDKLAALHAAPRTDLGGRSLS